MVSTIARFASRCAYFVVAVAVGGGAIAECQAQTAGKIATANSRARLATTVRSDARAQRPVETNNRHLVAGRPQGSLHRYYQEQSRAQAERPVGAYSSRRSAAMEMEATPSESFANPFGGETPVPIVAPPDTADAMRPLDPDSYFDGQEFSVAAPPPATP
ncbi:MAG TPA: hypothetical protein VHD36_00930 [Pirellulales bacterium]|nr:hypothetical protein [Pirellulales bacterium]